MAFMQLTRRIAVIWWGSILYVLEWTTARCVTVLNVRVSFSTWWALVYITAVPMKETPTSTQRKEFTESLQRYRDETGFHSDLTDIFDSEIIVKADFVH